MTSILQKKGMSDPVRSSQAALQNTLDVSRSRLGHVQDRVLLAEVVLILCGCC